MIIGIVGRRHVGKDLVSNYIETTYGYENRKFAGPMKQALIALFDFTSTQVSGDLKEVVDERWKVSPRQVMQFFGTDMMQMTLQKLIPDIGRNFAVKRLFINSDSNKPFCISDVRFQHEVLAIHERGGITIHIHRATNEKEKIDEIDSHESEAGIDQLQSTYTIFNNGTKEELFAQVDLILKNIKHKT